MGTEAADAALIEGTIRDLREAVSGLERQRAQLDAQIKEKRERLHAWEARLAKLGLSGTNSRPRQTRGENLRRLVNLLSQEPGGLTLAELSRRADVPSSSVRVLVRERHSDQFEEADGLIRLRMPPAE